MKRILASAAFLITCAISSGAMSGEFNSLAYVNQVDAVGFSRLDTASIVAPMVQMARDLPVSNSRSSNLGLVWQEGDFNRSSIDQQGTGNVGLIRQIGYANMATIQQSGRGHQAMIFQQGRNNTAIISQR